jgi:ankyrin repeat protein
VNSNPAAVPLLLEHGAGINAADENGIGALHAAAAMGRTDVVRLLAASGAAVEQLTASGLTPLRMAEAAGHSEIVDFLKSLHDADARAGSGEQPDSV